MSRKGLSLQSDAADEAAAWAARLADGQMTHDDERDFQAWLELDPENGVILEETIGAWDAVEFYAASQPVMALREAALASARKDAGRRARRERPVTLVWGAIAAVLLLVLGVGGLWATSQPTVYATGIGERRVAALSDGSKLSLDGATVVKVRYTSKERLLWLEQGRAQFEVAKNPLRPFSVQAGADTVVATGTAFSVELLQKQVRIVLYEGHVSLLERRQGGGQTAVAMDAPPVPVEVALKPGQQAILSERGPAHLVLTAGSQVKVEPADPVRSLSWEAGQLTFEDDPLSIVTERMNRYAAKPLAIGDAATGRVRISGVFRAGDTDALIQGLDAAFNVKARQDGDSITLIKSKGDKPGA